MPGSRFDTRPALVLLALLVVPALSPQSAPPTPAAAISAKGSLDYIVEWRLINAGTAKLTWSATPAAARPGTEIRLHLESTGLVSRLYKVNDDFMADLSADLCGRDTHLSAQEGSRNRETVVHFDPEAKKASYLERDMQTHAVVLAKETDIPACVHDVIGALFFLRTLNLEPGRSADVAVSDGKKSVSAKVSALGRESIKVPAGTFKTIRYEAFLFSNVLYRRDGRLYVWLTDDGRRLPVRIQVRLQFAIGTITFQLEKEEKT